MRSVHNQFVYARCPGSPPIFPCLPIRFASKQCYDETHLLFYKNIQFDITKLLDEDYQFDITSILKPLRRLYLCYTTDLGPTADQLIDLLPNLESLSFLFPLLHGDFVNEPSNNVVKSYYEHYLRQFLSKDGTYPVREGALIRGLIQDWRKRDQSFQITTTMVMMADWEVRRPFEVPVCIAIVLHLNSLTEELPRVHVLTLRPRDWSS